MGSLLAPLPSTGAASGDAGALLFRACGVAIGLAIAASGVALRRSPPRAPAPPSGARTGLGELAALLVVAGVLRAIDLGSGLWYDEIVTLVEFVRLDAARLATTYTSTNNHILFSLLSHASVVAFGESAWAVRLPAMLFGVASLAAAWWMAHELAPGRAREARLATWLVALSYHHVWFSQNARGYTGILLMSWLGTAIWLRARRGGPRALWLAYALSLALAMYTHLSAVFVFAAHGIVWLAEEGVALARRERALDAWPLVGFALGLALVLQLYAVLLPQVVETFGVQSGAGSGSATVTTWKNPLWTAVEIVRGLRLGPASAAAALVAFAIAATGFASIARARPFHALLIALPPVVTLAALVAIGFNIWPRYFLTSLAFAAVVLMRGIFASAEALARRGAPGALARPARVGTAAGVAVVALSAATLVQNYRFPKQDYAGARDFVAAERAPGDAVVAAGLAAYSYASLYAPDLREIDDAATLEALRSERAAGGGRVWVIYSFPLHLRSTAPELYAALERDFEPIRTFRGTLGDGDVHVLRSRAEAAPAPHAQATGSRPSRAPARERLTVRSAPTPIGAWRRCSTGGTA
ncbi:MAG: glycosyltransferase family 39 protein [Myxococcota bacterium]